MIYLLRFCFPMFCFVLSAYGCLCQRSGDFKRDSIDLIHIAEMQMIPDTTAGSGNALSASFKSIRVIDVRYDTTLIGIYSVFNNSLMPSLKNYKINLKNGLQTSLSNYLNAFFEVAPGAGDNELVCFIKTLSAIGRDTLVDNSPLNKRFGQLNFAAEVFLRSGANYYAAIKIDTLLYAAIGVGKKEIRDEIQDYLLMPALQLLRNKISKTEWQNISTRKAFSESTVMNHYLSDRFKIPVLTQPCKKGIYRSFEEFKNNSPSITAFEVKNEKFNTILIADSTGNYIPTIKLFAYCDGEKYWILLGNYRFPLIRVGNGFEFFLTFSNKLKILMALDMETGKKY